MIKTTKINFNEYGDSYDKIMESQHKMMGDISYYAEYKVKILKNIIGKTKELNTKKLNILEFGCGTGRNLFYMKKYFPNADIIGFDISEKSLKIAEQIDDSFVLISDSNKLKKYSHHFDIIFIAGVYHHIHPKKRNENTVMIKNLLKSDGNVLLFEHNPYNPVTRRMVSTCEFDKDAVLLTLKESQRLFQKSLFKTRFAGYTLFFPPRLKILAFLENAIRWIPMGGQYYAFFKKNNGT